MDDSTVETRNDFLVRRFDPRRDVEAVYRCYVSGFYHNFWPIIDHAEPRLLKDYLREFASAVDATIVAEADGEARGVLMGYFPAMLRSTLSTVRMELSFQARVLLRRYEMTAFARAAWWRVVRGEMSYIVRQKQRSPAEVLLLVSQKEYRGGIGRALMDGWVEETKSRGYDRTVVCTDSTVSWDFYERYGFERIRKFPLRSFFYSLPGVDVEAYIYSLDIASPGHETRVEEKSCC